jgi:hypothetical protein
MQPNWQVCNPRMEVVKEFAFTRRDEARKFAVSMFGLFVRQKEEDVWQVRNAHFQIVKKFDRKDKAQNFVARMSGSFLRQKKVWQVCNARFEVAAEFCFDQEKQARKFAAGKSGLFVRPQRVPLAPEAVALAA